MSRDMTQCPICESTRIGTDAKTVDTPVLNLELASVCGECGASWVDHYKYVGFDIDLGLDADTVPLEFEEDIRDFDPEEDNWHYKN